MRVEEVYTASLNLHFFIRDRSLKQARGKRIYRLSRENQQKVGLTEKITSEDPSLKEAGWDATGVQESHLFHGGLEGGEDRSTGPRMLEQGLGEKCLKIL